MAAAVIGLLHGFPLVPGLHIGRSASTHFRHRAHRILAGTVAAGYRARMNTATAQPTAAQLAAYLGQWMAVDEQVAAPLLRHLRPCRYERGEHFFQIGDAVDELVLLRDGLVRSYYLHDDREVNLRLLSAPAAAMPYNLSLIHI